MSTTACTVAPPADGTPEDHESPNFALSRRRSIVVAMLSASPASPREGASHHPGLGGCQRQPAAAAAAHSATTTQSALRHQRGFVSRSSDRCLGIPAPALRSPRRAPMPRIGGSMEHRS